MKTRKRLDHLDSLRGVAAVMVALLHFDFYLPFLDSFLFANAWVFVDLFFVLSGFIIAYRYEDLISSLHDFRVFMLARVARIWPLHILTLCFFIAAYFGLSLLSAGGGFLTDLFSEKRYELGLLLEFFLLHGLPFFADTSWNSPSWSISVEFVMYVLFGLSVINKRAKSVVLPALLILGAVLVTVAPAKFMESSHDFAWLRCLWGFSIGWAVTYLYEFAMRNNNARLRCPVRETAYEMVAVLMMVWGVYAANHAILSKFVTLIFGVAVLIFLVASGFVRVLLTQSVFRFLGRVSFTVYMLHSFVYSVVNVSIDSLWSHLIIRNSEGKRMWSPGIIDTAGAFLNSIILVLTFLLLLSLSHYVQRYFEEPARIKIRHLFDAPHK